MVNIVGPRFKKPATTKRALSLNPKEVARVAYELFERRGRQYGHDQRDWFEAERIVRQRQGNGSSQ